MPHRETRYTKSALRLPGFLVASAICGLRRLWVRLFAVLFTRRIRGSESRVAIYRIGSIGDFMHAMDALTAIRRRHAEARITLVTNAVQGEPQPVQLGIDKALDLSIVTYETPAQLRAAVREGECLYYLAPHPLGAWRALRDLLFFRGRAVGFDALTPRGWVARALRPWREGEPQHERLLRACRLERAKCAELPTGLAPVQGPYAVVAPVGKSQVQLWPDSRYVEVAQRLHGAGVQVVWTGSEEDAARVGAVPGSARFGLPFDQLRALLAGARVVVGNDSGLLHMAAYAGAPVVIVSSARSAVNAWRPPGKVTLLRKDMNCEACHLRQCSDVACLQLVSVDDVWAAVKLHLSS